MLTEMYWPRQYLLKCIGVVNTYFTEMYWSRQYLSIARKKKFATPTLTPKKVFCHTHSNAKKVCHAHPNAHKPPNLWRPQFSC